MATLAVTLYGLMPLLRPKKAPEEDPRAAYEELHRVGGLPRLVHVVEEVQPWGKGNFVAAGIMTLTGAGIILGLISYRRVRAERAAQLDATFWLLCVMSITSGVFYTVYRMRQRRRAAARRALRNVLRNPSRLKEIIVYSSLAVLVVGLILYRRYARASLTRLYLSRFRSRWRARAYLL